jgi:hypothetical protein
MAWITNLHGVERFAHCEQAGFSLKRFGDANGEQSYLLP